MILSVAVLGTRPPARVWHFERLIVKWRFMNNSGQFISRTIMFSGRDLACISLVAPARTHSRQGGCEAPAPERQGVVFANSDVKQHRRSIQDDFPNRV